MSGDSPAVDSASQYPSPGAGCTITAPPQQRSDSAQVPETSAPDGSRPQWWQNIVFLEIFAGEGVLTATLRGCGIPALPPDEFFWGGTDFADRHEVDKLKAWLQ